MRIAECGFPNLSIHDSSTIRSPRSAIEDLMIRDLQHAVRLLLRTKGWTTVVVVSLALGIGANTAIFTAINGLLLRTIPVDHPETLVRFRYQGDNEIANNFGSYGYTENFNGRKTEESFSYPMYERL